MRVLFAITVCCFGAVLWISLALARRIRLGQVLSAKPKPVRNPATREFFEAGEFRTPRPLHLDQEIFKQKPRRPISDINVPFERRPSLAGQPFSHPTAAKIERAHNTEPIPMRQPAAAYATLFGQSMSIAQIEGKTEARDEGSIESHRLGANVPSASIDFSRRLPPQPVRTSGLRRRIDLSHFNKDLGDLTDPYTNPLRGSGTQGPAAVDSRYRF